MFAAGERPRALVGRLRKRLRDEGPRQFARAAWRRLVYCHFVLMSVDLADRRESSTPESSHLDIRELGADDVHAYLRLKPDHTPALVGERLASGQLCIAAWSGDRIVSACWIRFDFMWVPVVNRRSPLLPRAAFSHDSWTDPAFRRQGIASQRAAFSFDLLGARGCRQLLAYVLADDVRAFEAARSYGFRPVGWVRWLHLAQWGLEIERRPDSGRRFRFSTRGRQSLEYPDMPGTTSGAVLPG
jgi:GNAT superfamily N-acetyltransferase